MPDSPPAAPDVPAASATAAITPAPTATASTPPAARIPPSMAEASADVPGTTADPPPMPSPPAPSPSPPRARVQEADFDVALELAALQSGRCDVGALASFVGCVRGATPHGDITALTLEHYPGMTERAIDDMITLARARFAVLDARVVHRVGRLLPGERIVLVAVAASHRRAAFEACEFLMDYLKTQAPFWKKEAGLAGERWVDARVADDQALARWGIASGNAGIPPADTFG